MRKIYFSFLALFVSLCSMAQITLPLNFEGAGPYTWTNFDGGNTTVINNPQSVGINTSTKVGQTIKGPGGQPWGGSWIQLAGPMDFTTLKFFRMKVFSKAPGMKVLLKVENESNNAQALEVNATTTKTNEWEDLSFNFSAINMAFTYHKVVVIFELGTVGAGGANFTFLFDDIRQEAAPVGALTPPKLPITFDAPGVDKAFVNFDGGATAVILNPSKTGINTTDTVARMVKNAGAPWAGSKILLGEALDFTTKKLYKVKVFSPRIGAKLLLKVEGSVPTWEVNATATKAGEWEELTYDYTGVNTALSYNQLVFILDLNTVGNGSADFTILFDDIRLEALPGGGGGGLTQMNVPVTFDDPTVNYGLIGFGGADASSIVADPTNASNKVARVIKSAGAEDWAGTTVSAVGGGGFSAKLPFAPGSTFMNVRVWSPLAGIPVRLKVEDSGDNTKSVETEATTTVANGWQTLVFDFTVPTVPATAAINYSYNYNKASIFFNYGPGGATVERTYYFDDMVFGEVPPPPPPAQTQMNVPVTFDDPTINYGVIGFGGADASSIVVDPTNAANKVAKVIKGAGAEDWAGTTVSAAGGGGFSAKLPFAPGSTFMNVRVWSPLAGIPVRLKVEDSGDNTKSVETEATTTVANGWQNLVFNFANQAAGTAAINFAFNYNKASIFFNYGPGGATVERTYYFDDMVFGATPLPVRLLSFDAKKEQTAVAFSWTTAQEVNNKGFAVQRSMDGYKYADIVNVAGNGTRNGIHTYTAKDVLPIAGLNYYRLKQEDLDGATVYSAVKVVDFSGMQLDAVKVYPNPARNSLNVVSAAFAGQVSYTIQSAEGRQVTTGNMNQTLRAQPIDISKLRAGIYYIVLRDGTTTQTVKFMVK